MIDNHKCELNRHSSKLTKVITKKSDIRSELMKCIDFYCFLYRSSIVKSDKNFNRKLFSHGLGEYHFLSLSFLLSPSFPLSPIFFPSFFLFSLGSFSSLSYLSLLSPPLLVYIHSAAELFCLPT